MKYIRLKQLKLEGIETKLEFFLPSTSTSIAVELNTTQWALMGSLAWKIATKSQKPHFLWVSVATIEYGEELEGLYLGEKGTTYGFWPSYVLLFG